MVTALVVDDNALALRLAQAILEREGHKVIAVANWSEVTNILFSQDVDIAFIDINMPGLQGDRLTEILKQTRRGRETPVVLCSNLPADSLREKAQFSGANDWIQKPLTPDSLRAKIEKLCHREPEPTG